MDEPDGPLPSGTAEVREQDGTVALHRVGQPVDAADLEDIGADAAICVVGVAKTTMR